MRSIKVIAPVAAVSAAAVIGLVSAMPSASSSAAGSTPAFYDGPVATASGGDVVNNVYPSIVSVRLDRAQAALARAATLVDQGKASAAVPELKAATTNMSKAWTAAKYVIQTAPPAPPPEDKAGAQANAAPDPVAGYATPEATGFAVLTLQHDVISSSLGMYDAVPAAQQLALRNAIRAAYRARDAAVAYIRTIAPPVPPEDKAGAHSSGDPVAADWASVMPTAALETADEIQQIQGIRAISPTLTPGALNSFRAHVLLTQNTINTNWPPVPTDD